MKNERRGQFTGRLISEEGMSDALRYLLEGARHYSFIINRSAINYETGENQEATVILSKEDPPSLEKSLDPRLKHSRHVIIVLIVRDGGAIKIDLTRRQWEIWIYSPIARKEIRMFHRRLLDDAHTRLISMTSVFWISIFPIWSSALIALGWSFSSRKAFRDVWATKSPTWPLSSGDQHLVHTFFELWPIAIIFSLGISIILLAGGGLGIWPKYLSQYSFQRAVYEFRSNFMLPKNINSPLFVGVVGVIVGALIKYLISHFPW